MSHITISLCTCVEPQSCMFLMHQYNGIMCFQIRKQHKRLNQIFILRYPLISNLLFSFCRRRSLHPRFPLLSCSLQFRSFRCYLWVDTERDRERRERNDDTLKTTQSYLLCCWSYWWCSSFNVCRWMSVCDCVCASMCVPERGDYIYVYMPGMNISTLHERLNQFFSLSIRFECCAEKDKEITMTINNFPKAAAQLGARGQPCTC